jgi:hypothetical protein
MRPNAFLVYELENTAWKRGDGSERRTVFDAGKLPWQTTRVVSARLDPDLISFRIPVIWHGRRRVRRPPTFAGTIRPMGTVWMYEFEVLHPQFQAEQGRSEWGAYE